MNGSEKKGEFLSSAPSEKLEPRIAMQMKREACALRAERKHPAPAFCITLQEARALPEEKRSFF
jgi:hypothetical protein